MRLFSIVLIALSLSGITSLFGGQPLSENTTLPLKSPLLTLYYAPWCYYCHKVLSYLESIGKKVPLRDIQNPLYKEELIRLGGKRQVPCLFINHKPLYESSAIIAWLSTHQDLLEDS